MDDPTIATRVMQAGLDWIVPDWTVSANVQAVVTTRSKGMSGDAQSIMDLGSADNTDTAILENRKYLRRFLPGDPNWLRQEHSANVVVLDAPSPRQSWPVADAAATRTPGVVCAVRMADCLPVLFADRRGHAVAVAHAGWRGIVAGVLTVTIETLRRLGSAPENVSAWLGPAIGPGSFEVRADVREAFLARDIGASAAFAPAGYGQWQADLYALATRQLTLAGIQAIGGGGFCTCTDGGRFFSWRRDRDSARMAALIWLTP